MQSCYRDDLFESKPYASLKEIGEVLQNANSTSEKLFPPFG